MEAYIAAASAARALILERLRAAIVADFPELKDIVTVQNDALRFQGDGFFAKNRTELRADKVGIIERLAAKLDEIMPCYTIGDRAAFSEECNRGSSVIEAVQIEGHTDDDGSDIYNMTLSVQRGVSTYAAMLESAVGLLDHRNLDGEPVLSVAGYGENRPVTPNVDGVSRSANRRIDLRFIMFSPSTSEQLNSIRQRLRGAVEMRP